MDRPADFAFDVPPTKQSAATTGLGMNSWCWNVCTKGGRSISGLWRSSPCVENGRYLVDPASNHMLVSKIKPCMSKYKQLYTVKLRTAHYISDYFFDGTSLHG